jgi:hypothetical protein
MLSTKISLLTSAQLGSADTLPTPFQTTAKGTSITRIGSPLNFSEFFIEKYKNCVEFVNSEALERPSKSNLIKCSFLIKNLCYCKGTVDRLDTCAALNMLLKSLLCKSQNR